MVGVTARGAGEGSSGTSLAGGVGGAPSGWYGRELMLSGVWSFKPSPRVEQNAHPGPLRFDCAHRRPEYRERGKSGLLRLTRKVAVFEAGIKDGLGDRAGILASAAAVLD